MKEKRSRTKRLALALLSVAVAVPLIIWWFVFHQSSASDLSRASTDAELLHKANKDVPAEESHSIVMKSPGDLLGHGGGGMETQTIVANCAKGFVRRGSVCEVGASAQITLSAASNAAEQNLVRPPKRE